MSRNYAMFYRNCLQSCWQIWQKQILVEINYKLFTTTNYIHNCILRIYIQKLFSFQKIDTMLKIRRFRNIDEIQDNLQEKPTIPESMFQEVLQKLKEKRKQCVFSRRN